MYGDSWLSQVKEYCGLVKTEDLLGGLWVPGDGVANPWEICLALGCEAIDEGVQVRLEVLFRW